MVRPTALTAYRVSTIRLAVLGVLLALGVSLGLVGLLPGAGPVMAQSTVDYDANDNQLIDISNLAQLNAIRWDLDGNGDPASANTANYNSAFPNRVSTANGRMGCPDGDDADTIAGDCIGYELMASLDLDTDGSGTSNSGDTYWNSGAGWDPIGDNSNHFSAQFDGNDNTISNLYIDRSTVNRVGLFARTNGAIISDVGLIDVNITASAGRAGALAGHLGGGGSVSGSHSTGSVATSGDRAGGLLGQVNNGATISDSYSEASVTASGGEAGGLTALLLHGSSVSSCYATGPVSGTTNVGGLVGRTDPGHITGSYATGAVTGTGDTARVGGLVGWFKVSAEAVYPTNIAANLAASYATGPVVASATGSSADARAGGLVGENYAALLRDGWPGSTAVAAITASYATGPVKGESGADVGGLVGLNKSERTEFGPSGVNGTGVFGTTDANIIASYSTGAVIGPSGAMVGGLVGRNSTETTGAVTQGATRTRIDYSYWDTGASGIADDSDSVAPEGETTRELQMVISATGSFVDWDDLDVDGDGTAEEAPWNFGDGGQYPVLAYGSAITADSQRDLVASIRPDHWNSPVVGEPVNVWLFDKDVRAHPAGGGSGTSCDSLALVHRHEGWTWQRSDDGSTGWADITANRVDTCSYTYIPKSDDMGKYLRACVPLTMAAGGGSHCTRSAGQVKASGAATAATASFDSGAISPVAGSNITLSGPPAGHQDRSRFRWLVCDDTAGANCAYVAPKHAGWSYTPRIDDVGKYIRVFYYYATSTGVWTRAATGYTGQVSASI